MSRTKGHSRSAITGSGGRGWDARFEPARGCPAPAFWLASAGRRSPVAWWRPLPEWRGRVLPGQAPQRREQDGTEDGAEDDPFELAVQAPPSVDRGQVGGGDLPGEPAQASARASRSVLAQVAQGGQDAGEQFPGRGVRLGPPAAAADELAGLGGAGLPGRVTCGVPVPGGSWRTAPCRARRAGWFPAIRWRRAGRRWRRWTARPPRPGRGSAAAAAGVTCRTAPGRGSSARRAVAVPRGGSTWSSAPARRCGGSAAMRIGPPARFAHEAWLEAGKVEHRAQAEQQALAIRLAADASPAPARRRAGRRSARSRAARAP